MQNINNNISFKSNIHFVRRSTFDWIKAGFEIAPGSKDAIYKGKDFWTEGVKSCSAGGFISKSEAIGFHFFHSKQNLKKSSKHANNILKQIAEPTNGLLLGGKVHLHAPCSLPLFKNLKNAFFSSVKNISIFEEHQKNFGQTHMFYSREKDTWWICSEWSEANNSTKKPVADLQGLLDFFKNISISTKDNLFIDGKKISEEQARIFLDNKN